jgi:hypothetical protein
LDVTEGRTLIPQQILRVRQGNPIPDGWRMVEWLGTESGIIWGPPNYMADVVLCERDEEATDE